MIPVIYNLSGCACCRGSVETGCCVETGIASTVYSSRHFVVTQPYPLPPLDFYLDFTLVYDADLGYWTATAETDGYTITDAGIVLGDSGEVELRMWCQTPDPSTEVRMAYYVDGTLILNAFNIYWVCDPGYGGGTISWSNFSDAFTVTV